MVDTTSVMDFQLVADVACSKLAEPLLSLFPSFLNWPCVVEFSNSQFFAAVVGSFAGAIGGAMIIERVKLRESREQQLRNTNVALSMTFTIANAAFNLKKQHLRGMGVAYRESKAAFLQTRDKVAAGLIQGNKVHAFKADLRTLPQFFARVDALHVLVYEKLSVTDRPLALVNALDESVTWLNNAITKRGELIEAVRRAGDIDAAKYFGLPYGGGHIDEEWPDTLRAAELHTDCIIYFSLLLIDDLRTYGEKVAKKLKRWPWSRAAGVNQPDFSKARADGLIPPAEDFQDWNDAFVSRPTRRQLVARWIRGKYALAKSWWAGRT